MLAVVLPAKNEAARIETVLKQVLRLPASLIIPVLNGGDDMTPAILNRFADKRIQPLQFREPLGYDVPRIAGARSALVEGASIILFVDADLTGAILGVLLTLVNGVKKGGLDLALSDCYAGTAVPYRDSVAATVYQARLALNEALGQPALGPAIPSHGPAAVSRRLLEGVPLWSVGVPPVMQAYAILAGFKAGIGAHIAHKELGSAERERAHRIMIAQTIIGDCLEGRALVDGDQADRKGHIGYDAGRRFDLVQVQRAGAGELTRKD